MKQIVSLVALFLLQGTFSGFAQESGESSTKKIEVTVINGEKKVTVTETQNGNTTVTEYKGANADAFMETELEETSWKGHHRSDSMKIVMDIEESIETFLPNLDDLILNNLDARIDSVIKHLSERSVMIKYSLDSLPDIFREELKSFKFPEHLHHFDSLIGPMKISIDIQMDSSDLERRSHHQIEPGRSARVIKKQRTRIIEITDVETEGKALEPKSFDVYPNPATETITISFQLEGKGDASLEVLDVVGKSVFSDSFSGPAFYHRDINMADLPSGIYLIRLSQKGKVVTKKLVLEH